MISLDYGLVFSLLLLGCVVGFIAGLLGVGGGGIMVPVLASLFLAYGMGSEKVMHFALGTSMASIIVTSFSSVRAHQSKNGVMWKVVQYMAPGMLCGAFFVTFVVSILKSMYLAIFFSFFMAYVAIQLFLNLKPKSDRTLPGKACLFTAGAGIGGISSLVSIGGGSLTVPYLSWHNVKMTSAIGTSAALGVPISLAGTAGYIINGWGNASRDGMTFGYIYVPAVLLISSVSFFTAPLGAKLAHKLSVPKLKKIFGLVLFALSIKMLISVVNGG